MNFHFLKSPIFRYCHVYAAVKLRMSVIFLPHPDTGKHSLVFCTGSAPVGLLHCVWGFTSFIGFCPYSPQWPSPPPLLHGCVLATVCECTCTWITWSKLGSSPLCSSFDSGLFLSFAWNVNHQKCEITKNVKPPRDAKWSVKPSTKGKKMSWKMWNHPQMWNHPETWNHQKCEQVSSCGSAQPKISIQSFIALTVCFICVCGRFLGRFLSTAFSVLCNGTFNLILSTTVTAVFTSLLC